MLLGVVGRVADVDATVRLVRGEEATDLAGAQVGADLLRRVQFARRGGLHEFPVRDGVPQRQGQT